MSEFNLQAIDETFTKFKVGAKVMAEVVYIVKDGLILNIGGKKDGFIPFGGEEEDAIEGVKVGDKFEAVIISTQTENGAVLLSKKRADDIRAASEILSNLKVGDVTPLIITGATQHGLLSRIGTFDVFVPFSQISARRVDNNLDNYVGKRLPAAVLEIDLVSHRIVASTRAVEEKEKIDKENAFWQAIYDGKIVRGVVSHFTSFGAFIDVGGVDCLLHNSEVSWDKGVDARAVLKEGEERDFKVISLDKDNKRVSLSLRSLMPNPLLDKLASLKVGDVVNGEVKKILPFGAVIVFGDDIEGLLHVKEASHFYVKNVYEVAKVGQKLDLKIIGIDMDNLKVNLSLKALQEEPEVIKLAKMQKSSSAEEPDVVYSTDAPVESGDKSEE